LVKIRLRRVGATKRPSYRIVAADSRSPRDGRFLEILGYYNPLTDPATVVIKEERVRYWVEHGAQPTEVVARLIAQRGVLTTAITVAEPEVSVPEPAPAPEAVSPTIEEAAVETERPRRTVRRRATAEDPATAEEPAAGAEPPRRTTRRRTTAEQPESQTGTGDGEEAKQESGDGP